jgi:hypothetical protein
MNPKKYKYLKTPIDTKVVFAIVIKPAHWIGVADHICEYLPVGALTWFTETQINYDNKMPCFAKKHSSVHPESNRYLMNFDPECFELLHTTKQKVKKR